MGTEGEQRPTPALNCGKGLGWSGWGRAKCGDRQRTLRLQLILEIPPGTQPTSVHLKIMYTGSHGRTHDHHKTIGAVTGMESGAIQGSTGQTQGYTLRKGTGDLKIGERGEEVQARTKTMGKRLKKSKTGMG